MRLTNIYHDERTFWHTTGMQVGILPVGGWVQPPAGTMGADTPESKRRILSLLNASGLLEMTKQPRVGLAEIEDLRRVHPDEYLEAFRKLSDANGGELGYVAPFSKGAFEIARISASLAIHAVEAVYTGSCERAYALCRPAGHHCLRDQGMGFCLLANIPIAIETVKARHGMGKVAVVDWDVHHGNGTQSIFYDRGDVLTISLHQDRCFPPGYSGLEDFGEGDGEGANINIPLPAGCGHDAYLAAMDQIVLPALERFGPEMIIVASGLDANAVDPLARMLLHSETYRAMTARLSAFADDHCAGRLVIVHEGGYAEAYVPFCGQAALEAMMEIAPLVSDPALEMFELQQPIDRALAFQLEEITRMAGVILAD